MLQFMRVKARFVLSVCLVAAVSGVFLFNATEAARSLEYEASGAGALTATVTNADCLAVAPKIGRRVAENGFSPSRADFMRFLILPGNGGILTAFSKSHIAGKAKTHPDNIKNTILVKLRI
jgi:hypothetical protein